jgi:arginine decarboxylase
MKELLDNPLICREVAGASDAEKGMVIGNRIPKDYFLTRGTGESDITIHAGSYHLALKQAGIERSNIMTYSSILPSIAREVSKPDISTMVHGAVMETIMAAASGRKGECISAGIVYGWLHHRKTGQRYGGLVCEHNGQYPVSEITALLHASLNELYINGFEEDYSLDDIHLITESFVPEKTYGTALVAICFLNYIYPVIRT